MRLKHANHSPPPSRFHAGKRRFALCGMMCIIIINRDTRDLALFLPAAINPGKFFNPCLYFIERNTDFQADRNSAERILNIMFSRNLQRYRSEFDSVLYQRIERMVLCMTDIHRLHIGLRI